MTVYVKTGWVKQVHGWTRDKGDFPAVTIRSRVASDYYPKLLYCNFMAIIFLRD